MKATGIVVEYNPFHNGHLHHVLQAKKSTNADVIIAVMSGNFLQRGEPALVDKWARTKMALDCGVDIVFELPYVFATAHAPVFAMGAIQLLDAARCNAFCFGSEDGSINAFQRSIQLIEQYKGLYDQTVKEAMGKGLSYPKALNIAYKEIIRSTSINAKVTDLSLPNNILGFHYIEAAQKIGSSMISSTIPRVIAGYHDDAVTENNIASATGIRKSFFESNNIHAIEQFIPNITFQTLLEWRSERQSFGSWKTFYPYLRFTIIREGAARLSTIADVREGIENLLVRAAVNNENFEGFMEDVKSKRYTWTRIQRTLTHIFTGFTYVMRNQIKSPTYLRLLGMTKNGQLFLNQNKKQMKLPIVNKVSAFSDPSLTIDCHASDMYALGIGNGRTDGQLGSDYQTHPIIR